MRMLDVDRRCGYGRRKGGRKAVYIDLEASKEDPSEVSSKLLVVTRCD